MSTNYEKLISCSVEQLEFFFDSLVHKPISAYVDWPTWLRSEDPKETYIGENAFYLDNDEEKPCRFLEEIEENGKVERVIYEILSKGQVNKQSLPKYLVRLATEESYPEEVKEDGFLAALEEIKEDSKEEEKDIPLEQERTAEFVSLVKDEEEENVKEEKEEIQLVLEEEPKVEETKEEPQDISEQEEADNIFAELKKKYPHAPNLEETLVVHSLKDIADRPVKFGDEEDHYDFLEEDSKAIQEASTDITFPEDPYEDKNLEEEKEILEDIEKTLSVVLEDHEATINDDELTTEDIQAALDEIEEEEEDLVLPYPMQDKAEDELEDTDDFDLDAFDHLEDDEQEDELEDTEEDLFEGLENPEGLLEIEDDNENTDEMDILNIEHTLSELESIVANTQSIELPVLKDSEIVIEDEDNTDVEIHSLLSEIKMKSGLFDPGNPEDLELPTIAFVAVNPYENEDEDED